MARVGGNRPPPAALMHAAAWHGRFRMSAPAVAGTVLLAFLVSLLSRAVGGWLAGTITRGHGFGFWIDALLGIAGSIIGFIVFALFGLCWGGLVGSIVVSTVGAVIVLALARLVAPRRTG